MDIDVVYTWVNHNDPTWRRTYDRAMLERKAVEHEHESSINIARFVARNELYYSVRSVLRYAPWVRNIYVVSNCELPEWSKSIDSIVHVKHTDIFPEQNNLPTFNSHAIETALHHIEGLSENFLYFNDDVFLCRNVQPENFFWGTGNVYYFPSKHDIPYWNSGKTNKPVDSGAINASTLLIKDFKRKPKKKLHHTVFPLSKSLLKEIEANYFNEVDATRSHAFRNPNDIAMATTMHAYYAEYVGRGKKREIYTRYVDIGDPLFLLLVHPWSPLMRGKYSTLCLNEVSDIKFFRATRDRIVEWVMHRLFG